MADSVAQLIEDVRGEGGFDATEAQVLRWLNRKWFQMVTEARAFRKAVAVGTTTAGEAFYPFSPVEAYSFELNGVPYGRARRPDVYAQEQGRLVWEGDGGLILGGADIAGVRGITLIPAPEEDGLEITSFAAVKPDPLTNDAAGDALLLAVLEDEFSDELVAGAIATALGRLRRRPDLAASYEQVFGGGVDRLLLRTKRRFRGGGPAQIRVQGVNA